MKNTHWYLFLAPLVLLAAAACEDGGTTPLSDSGPVLGTIPWTTPETATYNVKQGDTTGTGTLSILAAADSLVFAQRFDIPGNDVTDEITIEVNSETLEPLKVGAHDRPGLRAHVRGHLATHCYGGEGRGQRALRRGGRAAGGLRLVV
jgi:hypothetical protein